jgi:16S rRNA (guanine966-N2)-methyltransferase
MRVISGTARGRQLRAAPETRPTADLIKGAMFSILEALAYKRGFEPDEETGDFAAARAWPRVVDLFAGSGGLGIEALSRGAQFAEFVEQDRETVRILTANLRSTGLDDRARVQQSPVSIALRSLRGPVDLVFADPPYTDHSALRDLVEGLSREELLIPTSVVVLEHAREFKPPESVGPLPLASSRRHGRSHISLYASSSG